MKGMSLAAKLDRTSVAPVPMTFRALTNGSYLRRSFIRTDSKAASLAETRKAPPIIWTTVIIVSMVT